MVGVEGWAEEANTSQWRLSQSLVQSIKVARRRNRVKAWALRCGLFSETLALAFMLVTVVVLLR